MPGNIIYVYCMTDKIPDLKEAAAFENKLYFIYCSGLYAIAARVGENEFGEKNLMKNLENMEWLKMKASAHEKVIELVMKHSCVIPFKFPTLFVNEKNLKMCLNEHLEEFSKSCKHLADKEEWGLKIYCNLKKLEKSLVLENAKMVKLDQAIKASSPGKAYLLNKKREGIVSGIISGKLNEYGQDSFLRLSKHCSQTRINKLLSKEVSEKKEEMILNAAFLIKKNDFPLFIETINCLKKTYDCRGFIFEHSGPWPFYNFCFAGKNNDGKKQF